MMAALYIGAAFIGGAACGVYACIIILKKAIQHAEGEADFSLAQRLGMEKVASVAGERLNRAALKITGLDEPTISERLRAIASDIRRKESTPGAALAYRYILDAAAVEDLKANGFIANGEKVRVR